ncbi:MAG: glycosyltransferase [Clostridia bacterium]|nr:glycosyltransferase [Clostridia bacterium]MBQ7090495.1 glycosyltransferase [Clostridia bacterium]
MIKVLHIMTDATLGGAGRVLIQLLRCFDRERFEVVVAAPSGSALVPLIEEQGYRVIETEKGHDKTWEKGAVKEYKRIIRAEKPDIVHTHSSLAGKVAAYLCGVKSRIYTRHCVFDMPKKATTFPGKQINGLVNNTLATAVIAVAHAAKDNLTDTGVNPKKITVIINGVEPLPMLSDGEKQAFRQKLGIAEDEFVGLISARMEIYKGHSYLLETAKLLKDRGKKIRLILMGDGSCRADLEQQAKDLGIEDMVLFTGFVTDVASFVNISDLSLNCSYGTEASSIALAEGMSLGKPAVVTDFGGNPYMITDGVNGLVVPQKDPQAMADAIARVMEEPGLYAELVKGTCKEYQEKFTARAMTAQVEALYEKQVRKKES